MFETHFVLVTAFATLIALGVIAVMIPLLPGISFMFVMALVFGLIDGFTHFTLQNLAVLGGILLLSIAIDYFSGVLGARFGGAHWKSLIYGFIGLIIGLFIFPPLGIPLGMFAGIFIGEIVARKSNTQALKAATGGLIGSFAGVAINVVLALAFLVLFIVFAVK